MAAADTPREVLEQAVRALDQPHVGRVSVVSFSEVGPRVADLDVRVGPMGGVDLRRPTRWLVGAPSGSWLRSSQGATAVTPAATGAGLDVDAVLDRWEAELAEVVTLDTGAATPVVLVRRSGAPVEEIVYVDHASALPVRRETRGADGSVLRVVAYTSLAPIELGAVNPVAQTIATDGASTPVDLRDLEDAGYEVPRELGAGFQLLGVGHHDGVATARYGDGLSVLSVYQQQGRLDPSELADAVVVTMAGRDVWSWPGSEPTRLVWTSADRTWTAVTDAPAEVVADALVALPGDRVGHDVPSRVTRGFTRAWTWLRDALA